MSLIQKILRAVLPKATLASLEAETRNWVMRCPEGHEISLWDTGGVRGAGASQNARTLYRCEPCGSVRVMRVVRKDVASPPGPGAAGQ
jgi:hypothetical protein